MSQGGTDMSDDRSILRMGASVVLQFREKRFDLSLPLRPARARDARVSGRIEAALQFHQPSALTLEATIGGSERPAPAHHG